MPRMKNLNRITPLAAVVLVACLAAPSMAVMNSDPPPSNDDAVRRGEEMTPRRMAERDYGDAYREISKAREDLAKSNDRKAKKRFEKALERAASAVEKDSTYYEAWNLVGYAARNLADYDRSIAAYTKCLEIKPDYSAAHEYLGEAYVDLKQADKAREQVAWLEQNGDEELARTLAVKVEALEKASGGSGGEASGESGDAGTGSAQGTSPGKP